MSDVSSWSRDRIGLFAQELKIRLVVAGLLIFTITLSESVITDLPAALAALLLWILTTLVAHLGIKYDALASAQRFYLSSVVVVTVDIIAVTLFVFATGAAESSFFLLYIVCLVFAASFFRGLELALFTFIACMLYLAISFDALTLNSAMIWHLLGRFAGIIIIAWFCYALAQALFREKQANDRLLRHLAEGVVVVDPKGVITTANAPFCSMVGIKEEELVGKSVSTLADGNTVLAWVFADITNEESTATTDSRIGRFPDIDLPFIECNTIVCGRHKTPDGWIVVCKDIRDQMAPSSTSDQQSVLDEQIAPLANLRTLAQGLYNMTLKLDEIERLQAIETIEAHTYALRNLLGELLSAQSGEYRSYLHIEDVEIESLFTGTRRLLELNQAMRRHTMEIAPVEGSVSLKGDREKLARIMLETCKGMLLQRPQTSLIKVSAKEVGREVKITIDLDTSKDEKTENVSPAADTDIAKMAQDAILMLDRAQLLLMQHEGRMDQIMSGELCIKVILSLPTDGPQDAMDESSLEEFTLDPREQFAVAMDRQTASRQLNRFNNVLSVARGYAELAISNDDFELQRNALNLIISVTEELALAFRQLFADSEAPLDEQALSRSESILAGNDAMNFNPGIVVEENADVEERPLTPEEIVSGQENAKKCILIVDDEDDMRLLLAETLKVGGYCTEEARNVEDACVLLMEKKPDLAMVDLMLQEGSGMDVIRAARTVSPHTKIVVMTGYDRATITEMLAGETPDEIMTKPFSVTDILQTAGHVLSDETS